MSTSEKWLQLSCSHLISRYLRLIGPFHLLQSSDNVAIMRSSTDGPALAPPLDRHVSNRALKAMGLCALVLVLVFMQIPTLFSMDPSSAFRPTQVSSSDTFEHMFATKTKYWDQRSAVAINSEANFTRSMLPLRALELSDQTPLRQDLELIQTQIVARHGVRYASR